MNLSALILSDATIKTVERAQNNYRMCFFQPDKFLLDDDELGQLDRVFDGIVSDELNSPGVSCGYMPPTENRIPAYLKRRIYGTPLCIRNFFQQAAPFRRVICMEHAIRAGIPTPNLLACGRRKSYGTTTAVYICTEYINDAVSVQELFARPDARARVSLFIEDGLRLIASLHTNGFHYTGFSLNSFYYRGAILSLWNPAWIQYTHGHVSKKHILNDLATFSNAVMTEALAHKASREDFNRCDAVAERILISYVEIAPGWIPSCAELARAIQKLR